MPRPRRVLLLSLCTGLVALLLLSRLIGGLDAAGLSSPGEITTLFRIEHELGVARGELERGPWLADRVRTWVYAGHGVPDAWPNAAALRLPGAVVGGLLSACAFAWGLVRSRRLAFAWLCAAFALAFPGLLGLSRCALGNPVGELLATALGLSILALLRSNAGDARTWGHWTSVALLAALSTTASGLILGLTLPAAAAAASAMGGDRRQLPKRSLPPWIGLVALLSGAFGLGLALAQGDGYIPLLGAAKDLGARGRDGGPWLGVLVDGGVWLFPWGGAVVAALVSPDDHRGPLRWLLVAFVVAGAWSFAYRASPCAWLVPAALVCAQTIDRCFDPGVPASSRRFALLIVALGLWIAAKDATYRPIAYAWPWGHELEVAELATIGRTLADMARTSIFGLALAYLVAPASRGEPLPSSWTARPWLVRRWLELRRLDIELAPHLRRMSSLAGMGALLLAHTFTYADDVIAKVQQASSLARPMEHAANALGLDVHTEADDAVPERKVLALLQVEDPGLAAYRVPGLVLLPIASRQELADWLAAPADVPRVALLPRGDYPFVYRHLRGLDRALYLLDQSHATWVVAANRLPEGSFNRDRLPEILRDEAPNLAHRTLVDFDGAVEIIGWQIPTPLRRGSKGVIELALHVRGRMPANAKIIARLQKGRLSRINVHPHELAEGLYPPAHWREGDYILQRIEFEIGYVPVLPGTYELIVGMRRTDQQNLPIVRPEGEQGEFGVRIRGSKREFASIGSVEVQ